MIDHDLVQRLGASASKLRALQEQLEQIRTAGFQLEQDVIMAKLELQRLQELTPKQNSRQETTCEPTATR